MRTKSVKIPDPTAYFSDWHYRIDKHHFETLGVVLRQFVKDKIPYNSYAAQSPPDYQFFQGYIFYKSADLAHYLQVAAEWDSFRVEVHEGCPDGALSGLFGYVVTLPDFAEWLRTGKRPISHTKVDTASSKGGLLAWRLKEIWQPPAITPIDIVEP